LPIIFITSDSFALGLLLSIIANGISNFVAKALVLVTLPRSGETATKSSSDSNFSKYYLVSKGSHTK